MFGLFAPKEKKGAVAVSSRPDVPEKYLNQRYFDPSNNVIASSDGRKNHYVGVCFVGAPLGGASDATVAQIRSALQMPMPPGTYIQFGRLCTPDIESFLDSYLAGKSVAPHPDLWGIAENRSQFFLEGTAKPLLKNQGTYLFQQRLVVTINIPSTAAVPKPEDVVIADELADRLSEALRGAGLHLMRLDGEQFTSLLRLIEDPWSKSLPDAFDDGKELREQIFYPSDTIEYNRNEICFNGGTHYVKALSVKHYPKSASLAIMNYLIGDPGGLANQLTDPYWMVSTLYYPEQTEMVGKVRQKSAMINHQAFGGTANMIPMLGAKKEGLDILIGEMDGRGAILCQLNTTLFMYSKDKRRVERLAAGLQAYFASLAFELRPDSRILKALWNSFLPLNTTFEGVRNLYRLHTMTVSQAIQFLPIIGEWEGTGSSGSSVFVTRRGHPAFFDFYHGSTNYNWAMFAESGAGKSVATQLLICDTLAEGGKVWVIDQGRSYEKLCACVDGMFIEFSQESDLCLNPFTFVADVTEEMDVLKAIIGKMAAPETELTDYQMSLLEQAISSCFSRLGTHTTITSIAEWLMQQQDEEANRIGKQLFPWTASGSLGRWFEGESNLHFDKNFVVLEIQDLQSKKALQTVVCLILMSRIGYEIFLSEGEAAKRKKLFILDEAWSLIDDPVVGKGLNGLYRKARKHFASVGVVTQGIGDLYRSPTGSVIAENAAWQLILKQKAESIEAAIATGKFKIDPYGAQLMRSVNTNPGVYSEMMIKTGEAEYGVVRIILNRFSQVLFSTKGAERDDIFAAMRAGVPVVEAINDFIERENARKAA